MTGQTKNIKNCGRETTIYPGEHHYILESRQTAHHSVLQHSTVTIYMYHYKIGLSTMEHCNI